MNTLRQIKLDALKGNEYVMINVVNNKGKIHLELLPYTFTGILNLFLSVDYSDEDLNNAINELDITVGNTIPGISEQFINDTDENEPYPMMAIRIK